MEGLLQAGWVGGAGGDLPPPPQETLSCLLEVPKALKKFFGLN